MIRTDHAVWPLGMPAQYELVITREHLVRTGGGNATRVDLLFNLRCRSRRRRGELPDVARERARRA